MIEAWKVIESRRQKGDGIALSSDMAGSRGSKLGCIHCLYARLDRPSLILRPVVFSLGIVSPDLKSRPIVYPSLGSSCAARFGRMLSPSTEVRRHRLGQVSQCQASSLATRAVTGW